MLFFYFHSLVIYLVLLFPQSNLILLYLLWYDILFIIQLDLFNLLFDENLLLSIPLIKLGINCGWQCNTLPVILYLSDLSVYLLLPVQVILGDSLIDLLLRHILIINLYTF